MLKLVVLKHCVQMRRYFWRFYLTEWLEAEAAGETPAPVVPHTPLTLDAVSLAQHTSTGMLSQALSAEIIPGQMKHPTNSSSSTCDRPMPHRNRIWLPPLPFQLHSCLHIASSPWWSTTMDVPVLRYLHVLHSSHPEPCTSAFHIQHTLGVSAPIKSLIGRWDFGQPLLSPLLSDLFLSHLFLPFLSLFPLPTLNLLSRHSLPPENKKLTLWQK